MSPLAWHSRFAQASSFSLPSSSAKEYQHLHLLRRQAHTHTHTRTHARTHTHTRPHFTRHNLPARLPCPLLRPHPLPYPHQTARLAVLPFPTTTSILPPLPTSPHRPHTHSPPLKLQGCRQCVPSPHTPTPLYGDRSPPSRIHHVPSPLSFCPPCPSHRCGAVHDDWAAGAASCDGVHPALPTGIKL